MIAILAEDRSDAETLVVLVRRILGDMSAPLFRKGFSGCGELCRKAKSHINSFRDRGADRFIVCHDADRRDPSEVRKQVAQQVFGRNEPPADSCIVVPVQEIEAWIIADEAAVARVIPSLTIPETRHPEHREDPKEWLEDQSKVKTARPLYAHATHNPHVAKHIDLPMLARKCPSFQHLVNFVQP